MTQITGITLALLFCSCSPIFSQTAGEFIEKSQRLIESGKYPEAILELEKAIEIEPENADAYVKRAFAYSLVKEYEKAIADYNSIIALRPTLISAYLSRGSAFNKLGRFEEAHKDYDKVIELDPTNSEAYNNRGWSKKGLGDMDGACEDWNTSKKMGNKEAKIILKNNQC